MQVQRSGRTLLRHLFFQRQYYFEDTCRCTQVVGYTKCVPTKLQFTNSVPTVGWPRVSLGASIPRICERPKAQVGGMHRMSKWDITMAGGRFCGAKWVFQDVL